MTSSTQVLYLLSPYLWFAVLCLWAVHINWRKRKLFYLSQQLPGPPWVPFLAQSLYGLTVRVPNVIGLISKSLHKYRPLKLYRVWTGLDLTVVVGDADIAARVLATALTKGDTYQFIGKPFYTTGLFVDNNIPHWKSSRKIVTQILHFRVLKNFIPTFHDEVLMLLEKFQKFAETGQSFYPPDFLKMATYNTISRTTLGFDQEPFVDKEDQNIIDATHEIFMHSHRKGTIPIYQYNWIYYLAGYRKAELENIRVLQAWSQGTVERFKKNKAESKVKSPRESLVEVLMRHPGMSMEEVRAQIATIMGAGLDTSMIQNSVFLLMMAIHPQIQKQVYEEIVEVLGDDLTLCPDQDDLTKLDYLDRVLKETLRMFPAGLITIRKITEDLKVISDGKEIVFPAGLTVLIPIFYLHRSTEYYEHPEVFDPDRWLPESMSRHNPHAYLPFSAGPRNCIGGKYALLQMKTFACAILRKYEILPSDTCTRLEDIKLKMDITLILEKKYRIKLRERIRN